MYILITLIRKHVPFDSHSRVHRSFSEHNRVLWKWTYILLYITYIYLYIGFYAYYIVVSLLYPENLFANINFVFSSFFADFPHAIAAIFQPDDWIWYPILHLLWLWRHNSTASILVFKQPTFTVRAELQIEKHFIVNNAQLQESQLPLVWTGSRRWVGGYTADEEGCKDTMIYVLYYQYINITKYLD